MLTRGISRLIITINKSFKAMLSQSVNVFMNNIHVLKYTNPARGILDFCKQKFCRPLQYSPCTPILCSFEYALCTAGHCKQFPQVFPWKCLNQELDICKNLKKAPPPSGRGLIIIRRENHFVFSRYVRSHKKTLYLLIKCVRSQKTRHNTSYHTSST